MRKLEMDKQRLTLLQPEMRPKPIPDVGFSYPGFTREESLNEILIAKMPEYRTVASHRCIEAVGV
jgi:hypothetical protein